MEGGREGSGREEKSLVETNGGVEVIGNAARIGREEVCDGVLERGG